MQGSDSLVNLSKLFCAAWIARSIMFCIRQLTLYIVMVVSFAAVATLGFCLLFARVAACHEARADTLNMFLRTSSALVDAEG